MATTPAPSHHTLDTVHLPRGMVWIDEHDWLPVEKSTEYSITGALLVDASQCLAGRPITLQGSADAGWIRRDVLAQVRALASVPDAVYTLTLADGRTFSVMFEGGKSLQATPVARPEIPPANYPYAATVRLIEV